MAEFYYTAHNPNPITWPHLRKLLLKNKKKKKKKKPNIYVIHRTVEDSGSDEDKGNWR
jgi:hypothetical protein